MTAGNDRWDIGRRVAAKTTAVAALGFTERQARFLVTVMEHAGVFVERQYCAFAGITHGQKTHDFIEKLVLHEFAREIRPGALHRGRLYHVHAKRLYAAIGETDNRNRKPAPLGRLVERLMLLDAVLDDREHLWLGTEADKWRYVVLRCRELGSTRRNCRTSRSAKAIARPCDCSRTSCRSASSPPAIGTSSSTWRDAERQSTSARSSCDTRCCSRCCNGGRSAC